MEDLIKEVETLFNVFFNEERGNRLSQFSFVSLKETVLKMMKNYKPKPTKPIKPEPEKG